MYALIFSSSVSFIEEVTQYFEELEIYLGNSKVLTKSLNNLFAYQVASLKELDIFTKIYRFPNSVCI